MGLSVLADLQDARVTDACEGGALASCRHACLYTARERWSMQRSEIINEGKAS